MRWRDEATYTALAWRRWPMPEQKLLPPGPHYQFAEPWRAGRVSHGIVSNRPTVHGEPRDRAYYGGNMVAESMERRLRDRAVACVNFCAGFHFPDGSAYPGGLIDLVDVLEKVF